MEKSLPEDGNAQGSNCGSPAPLQRRAVLRPSLPGVWDCRRENNERADSPGATSDAQPSFPSFLEGCPPKEAPLKCLDLPRPPAACRRG